MMKYFFGFLNALPLSIIMWLLIVFLWITRQLDRVEVTNKWMFIVDLKDEGWFFRKTFLERGFIAYGSGNVMLVKDIDEARKSRTIDHETEHCLQCYKFSILFLILYIIESLKIYWFVKEEHPYYDNVFEIQARAAAGQLLTIPKVLWKQDRWFFW